MKKVLALALLTLLFFSCKKTDDGPSLDMVLEPLHFEIPSGADPNQTYHFLLKNAPTHFYDILAQAKKTEADVKGIAGGTAIFDADFADAEYKFLYEVSIRVYTEPDENDHLEAFYRLPIPDNAGNQLQMIPSLANLSRFLKADKISFDVAITPKVITPESIPTKLTVAFKIRF